MHEKHKSKKRPAKTDAEKDAIRRRKTIAKHGYRLPAGVTQCDFCHRPAGRDKEIGQSGELRQTPTGSWVCARHGAAWKTAKAI